MNEDVLKIIQDTAERGVLDLNNRNLTELPPEIRQLTNLMVLSLRNNHLLTLPLDVMELRHLTMLDVRDNQVCLLSPDITALSNLTTLNLRGNRLRTLPPEIGALSNLNWLYLGANQLNALPPEIGQLANLLELDLAHNQLSALPPEIIQLKKLKKLDLRGNPLPIPPEILERIEEPAVILDYYLQLLRSTARTPLREAKMLIVGQGGVGKTQIANRLCHDTYNEHEPKTEGIDIQTWTVRAKNREIKLNIWDFGGQEILHATHQFFLTKRSLYLFVWDARQEDRYSQIDYWLKLIQSFGADAPVLVVLNKCDIGQIDLDYRELRRKYSNIKDFIRISCKTGENLDRLKAVIANEVGQLKHIDDELSNTWFEVKTALEQKTRDFIEYREYRELCVARRIDKRSQQTLLGFLHDLGVVLNFEDDVRLRDIYILNPEWVTNAVYRILNYEPLKAQGILTADMLTRILDPSRYPPEKHRFILDMLKKFELSFEFGIAPGTFLIPELLPRQSPQLIWDYQDSLSFQYHYNFFPMSVITRFIVRMHPLIFERLYWQSGVVLVDQNNRALVKADRDERKILIWISGPEQARPELLAKIRAQFELIHATIPKIEARAKVPLPENPEIVVDYAHLLELAELGEATFIPAGLKKRVDVKQLLAGVSGKLIDD